MGLRFPLLGFARQFQTDLEVLTRRGCRRHARLSDRMIALDRLAGTSVLFCAVAILAWLLATQSSLLDISRAVASSAYKATFGPSEAEANRLEAHRVSAPLAARDVLLLQSRLKQLGFDPGKIDGIAGKHTLDALNLYRETKNLEHASGIERSTIADLLD
jgi:hypothetical protein